MKFVEGITAIRSYFVEFDGSIDKYVVLPIGIKKAPPFLRVGSQDWYQLMYICLMNGVSFLMSWITFPYFINICVSIISNQKYIPLIGFIMPWAIIGLILSAICFWEFSYKRVMETCSTYDNNRVKRMNNPIEYDLLEMGLPDNRFKWSFSDWIRFIDSHRGKSHE
jgi:hypothetical protein